MGELCGFLPGLGASPRSFRKVRCGEVFGVVTERKSLRDPALAVFWEAVRNRLERSGVDNRGRLHLPPLTTQGRFLVAGVMDGHVARTIDLGQLDLLGPPVPGSCDKFQAAAPSRALVT